MNNVKEIAETVLNEENAPPAFKTLARAYLELKKRIVLLLRENTLLILDSIEPRTDKDITIVGLKKEITKLKEENERLNKYVITGYEIMHKEMQEEIANLKKSREVLRKAVEFYGDLQNHRMIHDSGDGFVNTSNIDLDVGRKASEAMQADNEIFADKV